MKSKAVVLTAGAALLLLGVAGCGASGGGNSIFGGGNSGYSQCNPGTQVDLARPTPNQYSSGVTSIEVVAYGNSNPLGQSPGAWNIQVQDANGDPPFVTGPLNAVADPSGPHPFSSDFYYSGNLGTTLPSGYTWYVSLVQGQGGYQGCSPYSVQGSFST